MTRSLLAVIATCLAATSALADDADFQAFVGAAVSGAVARHGVPAIAVLVRVGGRDTAAVAGVRAVGQPAPATIADQWHIGSDTKAFTATAIARLVEKGDLRFDETLEEAFPGARDMDPAYRRVTLLQVLSHTAGLPALTSDTELPPFLAAMKGLKDVREQRASIAHRFLAMPPANPPGTFLYSNLGYIVAGAIAESATGKSWEALVRELMFEPLGIREAGFGAPGTPGKLDQPEGHRPEGGRLVAIPPGPDADNPPALGPAGTIRITLADWMRFAQDQLDGVHGRGKLLQPATYRKLHTPVTGNYALGWGAKLAPDGTPAVLTHSGSNGYWLAEVRIFPKHDMIVLVAMNAGNDGAKAAMEELRSAFRAKLRPED